jgi:predicted component of type VI protein secretion system
MLSRPPNIKFLTQPATLKAQSLLTENPSPLTAALLSAHRRTPLHPLPLPLPTSTPTPTPTPTHNPIPPNPHPIRQRHHPPSSNNRRKLMRPIMRDLAIPPRLIDPRIRIVFLEQAARVGRFGTVLGGEGDGVGTAVVVSAAPFAGLVAC